MNHRFELFMSQLRQTNMTLRDFVDFKKATANVDEISIKLNQLNYLIGQSDMESAVKLLWKENPKSFSVLEILIAVRTRDNKIVIDENGEISLIRDYFKTPEQVIEFLNETGLTNILKTKQIKNLVDYVFGIEVGLDSNARKNRGGHIMENIIANLFTKNHINFKQEIYYNDYPEIKKALGADKKRFDFVIETPEKIFLIETNFYTSRGSKLNEVARAYSELAPKINAVPGFEFVWITDGKGWNDAKNQLQEAFIYIPSIYNLANIHDFIKKIKRFCSQ